MTEAPSGYTIKKQAEYIAIKTRLENIFYCKIKTPEIETNSIQGLSI